MKKLLVLIAATVSLSYVSSAQITTNTFTDPYQSIVSSAESYLTSVNTNFTYAPVLLWDEVNYQNQVDISDGIGLSYDIYTIYGTYGTIGTNGTLTGGMTVSLEGGIRNIGIAGQVCSGQGGAGINYNLFDIRFGVYVDGGYNAIHSTGFVEAGFRLLKKPTQNTFAGLGLALQYPNKGPQYPLVSIFAGVTF